MKNAFAALSVGAFGSLFVGLAIAGAVAETPQRPAKLEARLIVGCDTDSDCMDKFGGTDPLAPTRTILVGVECGPDRLVMVRDEEDEFPVEGCRQIEAYYIAEKGPR